MYTIMYAAGIEKAMFIAILKYTIPIYIYIFFANIIYTMGIAGFIQWWPCPAQVYLEMIQYKVILMQSDNI